MRTKKPGILAQPQLAPSSHDNGPAHTSLKTTEFVTNNNMVIVPHPPYSSDLVPCDFTLFPKL
jgi:histone-lysine N-methyltransferase SETMAR